MYMKNIVYIGFVLSNIEHPWEASDASPVDKVGLGEGNYCLPPEVLRAFETGFSRVVCR